MNDWDNRNEILTALKINCSVIEINFGVESEFIDDEFLFSIQDELGQNEQIKGLKELLKNPNDLLKSVESLLEENNCSSGCVCVCAFFTS